jgi:mono/diheme cytochrome c family protein
MATDGGRGGDFCGALRTCVIIGALGLALLLGLTSARPGLAQEVAGKLGKSPQAVAAGRQLYFERCSFCHGLDGAGDGPVAETLDPRPRDFTSCIYKFRTTESGELPTDEDLFRTISVGVHGTAMPFWDNTRVKTGLTTQQRWQVVHFIKSFCPDFEDAEFDPYKRIVVQAGVQAPQGTTELLAAGKKVYEAAKCHECHGVAGRGNGTSAPTLKDDWGYPLLPRDLTKAWRYKRGSRVEDIYITMSTGLNGAAMPTYRDTLSDEARWQIAHYVKTLQHERVLETLLVAKQVQGELPTAPDDPRWAEVANAIDVPLSGQVLARPRLQTPSTDNLRVYALYNATHLALRLEWHDRFQDVNHQEPSKDPYDMQFTYPRLYDEQRPKPARYTLGDPPQVQYRDAVAIQFPVQLRDGPQKPHFFQGDTNNPVYIWYWKADGDTVEDQNGLGFDRPLTVQPQASQQTRSKASWHDGRWRVVLRRPLTTPDRDDLQIEPGRNIPLAFSVWDGYNGEVGLQRSLSTWIFLQLEASPSSSLYAWAVVAIGLGIVVEFWAARRARRQHAHNEP